MTLFLWHLQGDEDDMTKLVRAEGCGPEVAAVRPKPAIEESEEEEDDYIVPVKKIKKGLPFPANHSVFLPYMWEFSSYFLVFKPY